MVAISISLIIGVIGAETKINQTAQVAKWKEHIPKIEASRQSPTRCDAKN
jgi:hypothetical protein